MAYTPDIPAAGNDPSQDQPLMQANFQALNTYTSVNHVALDDVDQGKHKFLQMPEQTSDPATTANEGAVYTKENSGTAELFYRAESSGNIYQLSPIKAWCAFNGVGAPVILAGNNIASVARTAAGQYTVTFTQPLPSANYAVIVSPGIAPSGPTRRIGGANTLTTANFNVFTTNPDPAGQDSAYVSLVVLQ